MGKLWIQRARILDPSQNMDMVGDLLIEDGKIAQVGGEIIARRCSGD